jgi:hypothetical protein
VPPPKFLPRKFAAEYVSTNSPQQYDVDLVGQKNDFTFLHQKSFAAEPCLLDVQRGRQRIACA